MGELGERIRTLRTARGMTQKEFANRINVTKSAVSAYENGSRQPSYDVLLRMAAVLRVSTDHLLGRGDRETIDVTGLTAHQISTLRELAAICQRQNALLCLTEGDERIAGALAEAGLGADGEPVK